MVCNLYMSDQSINAHFYRDDNKINLTQQQQQQQKYVNVVFNIL